MGQTACARAECAGRTSRCLLACVATTLVLIAVAAVAPAMSTATPRAGAAAVVKKCRQFTLLRIRHGRRVHARVTKCVVVPSSACKVTWSKQRRNGRVVIRNGNPVWVANVTCPKPQPPSQPPAPSPIPTQAATYAITMTGTTYSGSTNFLDPTTVFTPLAQFTLTGSLLVEPPVGVDLNPQGQSTNGVNARDVGFFVGQPILGQAGSLWLVTDSLLFSQEHINLPSLEVLDVAFVTANEQAGTINIHLDGDLSGLPYARALPQNSYGLTSGLLGELAQILAGDATLQFSPDGRTVSGTVTVLGGGIIEPGSSACKATFTGARIS
jgi:hypothetical protein